MGQNVSRYLNHFLIKNPDIVILGITIRKGGGDTLME